jgi:3-phenylpropionate/cinnamic acid dioxygenase small subunit
MALQYELEQVLYAEAALLDDRRFDEWLRGLADDLEYWMPVRSTRAQGEEELEFAPYGSAAFFDDDKASMVERVRKLFTGFAWAEDPPSRTRHFVSNVRIASIDGDEVTLDSNVLVYRSRLAADEDIFSGRRRDTLRRSGSDWLLCKRHIYLDHVSLNAKNLSIFF